MMSTMSYYRPSKRPYVKDVSKWHVLFEDTLDLSFFQLNGSRHVMVEQGYPFPDFYRVTLVESDGKKSSKLFYGERAHRDTERFVYDLGFRNVLGRI